MTWEEYKIEAKAKNPDTREILEGAEAISEIVGILLPILQKYNAESAVIFGSYARNEAQEDSDIDVMVIGGNSFEPTDIFCVAEELHRKTDKNVDVYEEKEMDHNAEFYNRIISEGIKIC